MITFCKRLSSILLLQDRNVFWGIQSYVHRTANQKAMDHLAIKCDRLLRHDYMSRHDEVVRCIHLLICNKYGFTNLKKIRTHSVQEKRENENAEIRVDTRIQTDIKVQNNKPDIFIYNKKRKDIILIEIGITNQDLLQTVESEKI